jgi:hypothetical protein
MIEGEIVDKLVELYLHPLRAAGVDTVILGCTHYPLLHSAIRAFLGQDVAPAVPTPPGDKRFKNPAWNDGTVFDFIKQSYLLTANFLNDMVSDVEGVDPEQLLQGPQGAQTRRRGVRPHDAS